MGSLRGRTKAICGPKAVRQQVTTYPMDKETIKQKLNALSTGSTSRSQTARLRDIYDEVNLAIKSGVKLTAIIEMLNQNGFNLTRDGFKSAIKRIRKEKRKKTSTNQQEAQQQDATKEQGSPPKSEAHGPSAIKRSGMPIVRKKEINLDDYINSED